MTDRAKLAAAVAADQGPPSSSPPLQAPRHPDEVAAAYTGSDPAEVARITAAMAGAEVAEQQRQELGGLHGLTTGHGQVITPDHPAPAPVPAPPPPAVL
jgi:hypothetical protein